MSKRRAPFCRYRGRDDIANFRWSAWTQSDCKPVGNCLNSLVKLIARSCELHLANPWKIASSKGSGTHRTVIVELTDARGTSAIGEAAPSSLYGESSDGVLKFLQQLDAKKLSYGDDVARQHKGASRKRCREFRSPPDAR